MAMMCMMCDDRQRLRGSERDSTIYNIKFQVNHGSEDSFVHVARSVVIEVVPFITTILVDFQLSRGNHSFLLTTLGLSVPSCFV